MKHPKDLIGEVQELLGWQILTISQHHWGWEVVAYPVKGTGETLTEALRKFVKAAKGVKR